MFRTALRNVFAHKARLLMTVLAVMLGVAFVSGTLVFTNTISGAMEKSSAKGYSHVDVAVTAQYGEDKGNTVGKEAKLTDATLKAARDTQGSRLRVRRPQRLRRRRRPGRQARRQRLLHQGRQLLGQGRLPVPAEEGHRPARRRPGRPRREDRAARRLQGR